MTRESVGESNSEYRFLARHESRRRSLQSQSQRVMFECLAREPLKHPVELKARAFGALRRDTESNARVQAVIDISYVKQKSQIRRHIRKA